MRHTFVLVLSVAWLLAVVPALRADETTTTTTIATSTTTTTETSTTSTTSTTETTTTTEPSTTSTTVLVSTTSTSLEPTTTSSSTSITTTTSTSTTSTTSTSIQVCTCDDLPFMAQFSAKLSSGVIVDHDLGVNDAQGVATLAPGARMSDGSTLYADRVKIAAGATVYNVRANVLIKAGSITGSEGTVNPPLQANFCDAPIPSCGTGELQVKGSETMLEEPGDYGRVSLAAGAVLYLPGNGTYRFCELRIASRAQVLLTHQATVEVAGNVIVGTDSSLRTIGGAPFILRVGGPKLLLGRNALVTAAIMAPNAKGKVKAESHLQGCMCANFLKAARDARLTCTGDSSD